MISFSFPERPDLPCWNIEAAQAIELCVSPGNSALEAQLEINSGGPLYALIEDAELPGFRTFGDFLASRDGGAVARECCFLEITELEGGRDIQVLNSTIQVTKGSKEHLWLQWNGMVSLSDVSSGALINTAFELVCEVLVVFDWQLEVARGPHISVDPACSRGGDQPEQLNRFLRRASEVLEVLGRSSDAAQRETMPPADCISKVVLYDLEWEDCVVCRSRSSHGAAALWVELHLDRRYVVARRPGIGSSRSAIDLQVEAEVRRTEVVASTAEAWHAALGQPPGSAAREQGPFPDAEAAVLSVAEAKDIFCAFARWKEVPEPFKIVPA